MTAANLYFATELYIILFIVCLTAAVALFWKFPSLRGYRRKRNLLAYAVVALVLGLFFYQAYDASSGTTYVFFMTQKPDTPIYAEHQNSFTLTCYSSGNQAASLYAAIHCTNATLQTGDQQDYIQVDESTVKIPFNIQRDSQESRPVYFTVYANVSSFSVYMYLERQVSNPHVAVVVLDEMLCQFDPQTQTYAMADSGTPAYPP